jgi:protein-S-isoprenylcysteine O-methyltransferase Ste14
MYVGAAAAILGCGLALSSPSIVLLALAFLLVMHLFVVLHEEPTLLGKFGISYQRYCSSVRRWLIQIPRSSTI